MKCCGAPCLFTGVFQPALPDGTRQQSPPEGQFVGPENTSPHNPEPAYQAGELAHYEGTAEHGFYERESEEQGSPPGPPPYPLGPPPPPPYPISPELGMIGHPYPELPYIVFPPYYYDYSFLTGQYPPGTYTHASSSFEHGLDGWKDVHYLRELIPYQAEPVQQPETWYPPAPYPGKAPRAFTG